MNQLQQDGRIPRPKLTDRYLIPDAVQHVFNALVVVGAAVLFAYASDMVPTGREDASSGPSVVASASADASASAGSAEQAATN